LARITSARYEAYLHRRSERYAIVGRENEHEIERILKASGTFSYVERHEPDSRADSEGKDFTVRMVAKGVEREVSFGVTISHRRWSESRMVHPDVPQIHTPIGMMPETIVRRVVELFRD
jgi:hypothetical protein